MNKSDFAEILTALFNGNAGEARQVSEQMLYDDTFNISDEYDRRKQDRINYFEVLKLRKNSSRLHITVISSICTRHNKN